MPDECLTKSESGRVRAVSILAQILADKVVEVAKAKEQQSLAELEAQAAEQPAPICMAAALRRESGQPVRVIAEFKRASPSAGAIRADADPVEIAQMYEQAGASAISVLTDKKYFDGRLSFLPRIRKAVAIPLLRKDFVIDPYQITEARAHGADAVLLIVSALQDSRLDEFYQCARSLGMRALVEVHDEHEAERAAAIGAEIIGVNHRNLKTFEVDLGLTARLAGLLENKHILVGESGIRGPADLKKLGESGAHAVLVGETLMRSPDPGQSLLELRGQA